MNALQLVEIPDDLAAEAVQVPGLPERLLSFLRAEVLLHQRRQGRYSAQAREIAQRAMAEAEQMKAGGVTPEQAKSEFGKLYAEISDQIAAKP